MQLPIQVTFHDVPPTPALEDYIVRKAEKLARFSRRLMRCRVAVEAPRRVPRSGARYAVRIDLIVGGDELVVGRHAVDHDLYAAIDRSMDEAKRVLEDHARLQRAGRHRGSPRAG